MLMAMMFLTMLMAFLDFAHYVDGDARMFMARYAPKEPPQEPVKGKPPKPKAPKEQCPICLRWYSLARVAPGMHKCVPPVPKSAEPEYDREERPMLEPPKPPETPAPVESPKFEERQINYDDVMRFLTRERLSRHERKRESHPTHHH